MYCVSSVQMCIFLCLGGNSTTWMNTAVLVTCIRNFRKNRGPVAGILKGYVALSTAIFTDVCSALFSDSAASFLLMLSISPFAVCLTAAVFLHEVPPAENPKEEVRYFSTINGVAVIVAFYLLAYDFSGSHGKSFEVGFVVILLALLASPLFIPLYNFFKVSKLENDDTASTEPLLSQEVAAIETTADELRLVEAEGAMAGTTAVGRKPQIGEDHTIFEAMRTYDFWILFVSFLFGVGTGMAVQNNMGQIGEALGYDDVSVFVSLISVWGFFGRIISGTGSEYLIK